MKVKVFLNDTVVEIPAAGKLSVGDEFLYEGELWAVKKSLPSFYETGEGSEIILKCVKAGQEPNAENPKPKNDSEEDKVEALQYKKNSRRKSARVSQKELESYSKSSSNFDDTVLEWLHQCRVYGIPDPDTFKELTPKLYGYFDTLGCCSSCPSPGYQFIQDIFEGIRDKFPRFYNKHLGPLEPVLTCMDGTDVEVENFIARLRAAVWKQVTGGEDIRDVYIPPKSRQHGARNLSSLKSTIRLDSSSYWDSDVYDEYSRMMEEYGLYLSRQEWDRLIRKDSNNPEGSLKEWSRMNYYDKLFKKHPEFEKLADKIRFYDSAGGKKFEYTFENLQLFRNIVWNKLTGEAYLPSIADAIEILRHTIDCACDTESSDDYDDDDDIEVDCSRRAMREIDDELAYEDFENKPAYLKAIRVIVKGKPRRPCRSVRDRYDSDDQYDEI